LIFFVPFHNLDLVGQGNQRLVNFAFIVAEMLRLVERKW
jgi:hypothetical protein